MELIIQSFCYSDLSNPKMARRQAEMDKCLQANMAHPHIKKIHILTNAADKAYFEAINPDATIVIFEKQPTYKDFVEYANTLPKKTLVIFCNSDIEIGEIKNNVHLRVNNTNMYAITRHEKDDDGIVTSPLIDRYMGSHDLYVFSTPIRVDTSKIDHKQNLFGAENKFLYYVKLAGYNIYNPCRQFIIYHRHFGSVYFENYARVNMNGENFVKAPDRI